MNCMLQSCSEILHVPEFLQLENVKYISEDSGAEHDGDVFLMAHLLRQAL